MTAYDREDMDRITFIAVTVVASILVGVALVALAIWSGQVFNFSDTDIVALIAAAAGSVSIVSSVTIAVYSSAETAKQQRLLEVRAVRQQCFHRFLEVMSRKLAPDKKEKGKNEPERYQASSEFCAEFNRLPLYASQRLVEEVNGFVERQENPDFADLYSLIRADLCSENFEEFQGLTEFHFQVLNPPPQ